MGYLKANARSPAFPAGSDAGSDSVYLWTDGWDREDGCGEPKSAGKRLIVSKTSVYEDVLTLYSKAIDNPVMEYPFHTQFEGKIAIAVGGVTRDMFSAFFSECTFIPSMVLVYCIQLCMLL